MGGIIAARPKSAQPYLCCYLFSKSLSISRVNLVAKATWYISRQSRSKATQHISYCSFSFQFCSNFVPILFQFCFIFVQILLHFVQISFQFCSNLVPTQVEIGFFAFLTACWFERAV